LQSRVVLRRGEEEGCRRLPARAGGEGEVEDAAAVAVAEAVEQVDASGLRRQQGNRSRRG
jgi:hypothetical protein